MMPRGAKMHLHNKASFILAFMLRYFIFTQLCKHGSLINALIILFVTSYYVLYNIVQIQYKYATLLIMWKTAWLQLFNLIAVIILSFKVTYLIQISEFTRICSTEMQWLVM